MIFLFVLGPVAYGPSVDAPGFAPLPSRAEQPIETADPAGRMLPPGAFDARRAGPSGTSIARRATKDRSAGATHRSWSRTQPIAGLLKHRLRPCIFAPCNRLAAFLSALFLADSNC
jgi:hypothetical protein